MSLFLFHLNIHTFVAIRIFISLLSTKKNTNKYKYFQISYSPKIIIAKKKSTSPTVQTKTVKYCSANSSKKLTDYINLNVNNTSYSNDSISDKDDLNCNTESAVKKKIDFSEASFDNSSPPPGSKILWDSYASIVTYDNKNNR